MTDKLKIMSITDKIVMLNMETQKEISQLLIRFQEYYESPIPEIKGKIFTLGYLKSLYHESYRTERASFTYHDGNLFEGDWTGFNFPSWVLEPFVKGLFDPLSPGEQDVVDLFGCRQDDFYIIGTFGENHAVEHEICHGLFYTEPKYKEKALTILGQYNNSGEFTYDAFKEMLRDMGYCEEVLEDETQAYICADYDWLLTENGDDLKRYNISIPEQLHKNLQNIKEINFEPTKGWEKWINT